MKICSKCGIEKPLDQFHKTSRKYNGQLIVYRHAKCKECRNEERKERYKKNSEKELTKAREYYRNNSNMILRKQYEKYRTEI